jgi:uncharacterized protein
MRQLLEIMIGSHAYGTNIESSDIDKKLVHQCSNEEVFLYEYRPQIEFDKDTLSFEIKRFLELLMNANPNILELLFTDEKFILYKNELIQPLFEGRKMFLTKKCFQSFGQYAIAQIRKATAFDKKINWEKERVTRKDVLDFCYILNEKENSSSFKKSMYYDQQEKIGLAKVNHFPDIYSLYLLEQGGGIVSENSNEVQLRTIPKDAPFLSYLRFDRSAYSTHCKDYREYESWLNNRNTSRYTWDIKEHVYDMKNLMHCRRLLDMALEIGETHNLTIYRENRDFLLDIRKGNVDVKKLVDDIKHDQEKLTSLFEQSTLPDGIDDGFVKEFLLGLRRSY